MKLNNEFFMHKILRSKINRRIIKSIGNIGIVILMIAFSINLGKVGSTSSSFRDAEVSADNNFTALSLDMEVVSGETELQDPAIAADMVEGDGVSRSMLVENVGSSDYSYNVSFDKTGGDDALCMALNLTADQGGIEVYNGSLIAFDYDAGAMSPGDIQDWDFEIILPLQSPSELEELDCSFEFNAVSWQTTMSGPGTGWSDEEDVENNDIHTGSWTSPALGEIVMNEFLPNPVGTDTDTMPGGEWIEIFNNSLVNRDLKDWYFEDAAGNRLTISSGNSDNDGNTTDVGETMIVGGGYLVVYDNSIFSLNNGGDTIYFYDKLGVFMDSYTYGDTSGFPEGKSYARAPDGVGAWVDPEPTPGEKVEFSDEEMLEFRKIIYADCFSDGKLIRNKKQPMCLPITVEYFGLIKNEDSKNLVIPDDLKKYLEDLIDEGTAEEEEKKDKENKDVKAKEEKEDIKREIPKTNLKKVSLPKENSTEIIEGKSGELLEEELSGEEPKKEDPEAPTNNDPDIPEEVPGDDQESEDSTNDESDEVIEEEIKDEDPVEDPKDSNKDTEDSDDTGDTEVDEVESIKEEEKITIEIVE